MKTELKNFNKLLSQVLISQEVKATINGEPCEVKDDGKGNVQISAQVPVSEQTEIPQTTEEINYKEVIATLKEDLHNILLQEMETSKAAKHYSKCSPEADLPKVMYNYGFAEGKKNMIKYILNTISSL